MKTNEELFRKESVLLGFRKFENSSGSEIVLCNYIPVVRNETDEQRMERIKRERAGKTFAKVKLSNPNPRYRHKRGEVIGYDGLLNRILLEIETVNTCTTDGCYTLIGVAYPHGYEKIWFEKSELECFERYDDNGDNIDEKHHD